MFEKQKHGRIALSTIKPGQTHANKTLNSSDNRKQQKRGKKRKKKEKNTVAFLFLHSPPGIQSTLWLLWASCIKPHNNQTNFWPTKLESATISIEKSLFQFEHFNFKTTFWDSSIWDWRFLGSAVLLSDRSLLPSTFRQTPYQQPAIEPPYWKTDANQAPFRRRGFKRTFKSTTVCYLMPACLHQRCEFFRKPSRNRWTSSSANIIFHIVGPRITFENSQNRKQFDFLFYDGLSVKGTWREQISHSRIPNA